MRALRASPHLSTRQYARIVSGSKAVSGLAAGAWRLLPVDGRLGQERTSVKIFALS
jgi:hypothetical protein